jgi:nicotinate-nucleotide pyrophosphorylase (carboxylating)
MHSLAHSVDVLASMSFLLQLLEVVASGAPHVTRVMLDNMTRLDANSPAGVDVSLLQQAVGTVGGRLATEGSGNVTLHTVAAIASSGVDFVSVGALTHSVKALDISLNIVAK